MSDTTTNIMDRVRYLTDDRNSGRYEVSSKRMLSILSNRLVLTQAELPTGETEYNATITIVAGTTDYALNTSPAIVGIVQVLYNDHNTGYKAPLPKVSLEAVLEGLKNNPVGRPTTYAAYETQAANVTTIKLNRIPGDDQVGDTISYWVQKCANNITTDGSTVYASNILLSAIEKGVAAECVMAMKDEALAKRSLNREIAQVWMADWQKGISLERARLYNMRRSSTPVMARV